MSDLRYSLTLDLAGNLASQARKFGGAMGQFAQQGQRHLGRLQGAFDRVGQGMDALGNRYTALIGGAAGAGAIRFVGNMDARVRALAVDAGRSLEEMQKLRDAVYETAQMPDIRLDPSQIMSAIEAIVGKTGDVDFAKENLRNIGLAIRGIGVEGKDVGAIMSNLFMKSGLSKSEDIMAAFDIAHIQGKQGAVAFRQVATEADEAMASYSRLRRSGIEAFKELSALQQVFIDATGSPAETTTAINAVVRNIQNTAKAKKLEAAGIKLFEDDGTTYRALGEIMKDVIRKTKGDARKIGMIFEDEAMKGFSALALQYDEATDSFGKLDNLMSVSSTGGEMLKDAKLQAEGFNSAMQSLTTTAQKFADTNLAAPVQGLADAMNALSAAQQDAVASTLFYGAGAVGGVLAGRKLYQGGKWLAGLFGKGKKGGAGGAAGALGGLGGDLGPTPVAVVNWPVGMMGGMGASSTLSKRGAAGRAGLAAAGRGSRILAGAKGLLGRAGIVSALVGGAEAAYALSQGDTDEALRAGGRGLGGWGGMAAGAATGAALGSVVPVVGTAAGGLIGGIAGGIGGSALGEYVGDQIGKAWDDWFGSGEKGETKVGGTVRIEVDGAARVRDVKSDNPDVAIEASAGPLLGGL